MGAFEVAQREETRDRILEAAMSLFADMGFHATTTDAVAAEAGVAVGTIYNYFRSKEEILSYIFLRASDERIRYWRGLEAVQSPSERVLAFIEWHFSQISHDPRLGVILVHCLVSGTPGMAQFQHDMRRAYVSNLELATARQEIACDPEVMAIALMGIMEASVREGVARLARCGARQDMEGFFSRAMLQISALLRGLVSSDGSGE